MTGHTGSDKSTFQHRIERYADWVGKILENIHSGMHDTGFEVIKMLIVDDGVPDRGHRYGVFNN